MPSFNEILDQQFSGAIRDHDYVARTASLLHPLGFTADNAIAAVATCRDELCRPIHELVHGEWGEAFNFSSLGGMLTLGRTGFGAFHAHAPRTFARRQHVYYAMPHLGIGVDGKLGAVSRRGIPKGCTACGALFAFANGLEAGPADLELDFDDLEQSLLKKRLLVELTTEPIDSLELIRLAARVIREDLEASIAATVDASEVDYAVFTGIQIHGPERRDYVLPLASYAVVSGERYQLAQDRTSGTGLPQVGGSEADA